MEPDVYRERDRGGPNYRALIQPATPKNWYILCQELRKVVSDPA